MNAVPEEVLRVIAAAIEDHRTVTPPDRSSPAALAEDIAVYLISSHWTLTRTDT
ncbi:hypothetical protein OG264_15985 [Streptomyces xanthophaeus]|uniref:hypothetical protein n=1 Tax=Streptomyces xanthophaeus TaxID=67385 RepID=UPI00386AF154|nr:hypothetical protein OG264_15985 [Streptomyces xanthophaeus]WST62166.1 hypothetical protein OG605_22450 [Streptomyces xanthophaeus]